MAMSHSHSHSPPQQLLHPPVPFDDFEFFNPNLQGLLPSPPPLPSSSELFSASETTDFLGFLDNIAWDFQVDAESVNQHVPRSPVQQYHQSPPRDPSGSPSQQQHMMLYTLSRTDELPPESSAHTSSSQRSPEAPSASTSPPASGAGQTPSSSSSTTTAPPRKPLLSTPQKRLNHIMSEQKRRNAIRDGYVQLTNLLAPAGAPPGLGMPTRGRPKGSGSRGRGTKGKSGILFRAKEYIQWLEEGNLALRQEVLRVEAAAGLHS